MTDSSKIKNDAAFKNLTETFLNFGYKEIMGDLLLELQGLIDSVIKDDTQLKNGNIFSDFFNGKTNTSKSWWRYVNARYKFIDNKIGVNVVAGISNLLIPIVKEKIIGDTSNNIIQQTTVMTAILETYFKSNKLGLVYRNMDRQSVVPIIANNTGHDTFVNKVVNKVTEKTSSQISKAFTGAGPVMIKILQLAIQNNNQKIIGDLTVSKAGSQTFDSVHGLSSSEQKCIVDKLRDKQFIPVGEDAIINPSAKSASLGQILFTKKQNSKQGGHVIKFLKPISLLMGVCEIQYCLDDVWKKLGDLLKDTSNPGTLIQCRQFLLFMVKTLLKEFDFKKEHEYTNMGFKVFNKPNRRVRSIRSINYITNPLPCILLTKGPKDSLTDFLKSPTTSQTPENISTCHGCINTIYTLFIRELLFKTGFFHADIHAGNILVEYNTDSTILAFWIIDYGNCGIFRTADQGNFFKLVKLSNKFEQLGGRAELTKMKDESRNKVMLNQKTAHTLLGASFRNFSDNEISTVYYNVTTCKGNMKKMEKNKEYATRFIDMFHKLCQITIKDPSRTYMLSNYILDYTIRVDFNMLLLNFAVYASNLGECIDGPLIHFARGLSFLNNLIKKIESRCVSNCAPILLDTTITKIVKRELLHHFNLKTARMLL